MATISNFIFKFHTLYECQAGGSQQSSENVAMVVTTTEGEVLPPEEQTGKAKACTGTLTLHLIRLQDMPSIWQWHTSIFNLGRVKSA